MKNALRLEFIVTITPGGYAWKPQGTGKIEMDVPEDVIRNGKIDFSLFLSGMVPHAYNEFVSAREDEKEEAE
jgi:hypothetical protein